MNLNNLQPAWRQFKLQSAMQRLDQTEILSILETAEDLTIRKTNSALIHLILFIVVTACCHGG